MVRVALSCLVLLVLVLTPSIGRAGGNPFTRGDVNDDGSVNIADAVSLLAVLFTPGTAPLTCEDVGDANDDGNVNIADAISILGFLFDPAILELPEPSPTSPPGFDATPTDPFLCGDEPIGPPPPGGLTRIAAGDDSLAPGGEYVIRDAVDWNLFWQQHAGQGATAPNVDFSEDIVLAVVIEYVNGTHCSEIVNAAANGEVQVRHYHWQLPCAPLFISTVVYDIVVWENAQQVPDPLLFSPVDVDTCPLPCP